MAISNTQYQMIMRTYEKQQLQNQQLLSARKQEIRQKLPEYEHLNEEIRTLAAARARSVVKGELPSSQAVKETDAQIALLSQAKKALLLRSGYPADYLMTHYQCPDCQDTGYIGGQKCHCFSQAIIDLLYTQSQIRDLIGEDSFSSFSLDYYPEDRMDPDLGISSRRQAAYALRVCRDFTGHFDSQFQNLFLYGNTGLGKTFLSHCIARELLNQAHSVIYFSAFRLFDLFADTTFHHDTETDAADLDLTGHIYDCDLLIIDDLGTEMTNRFVSSSLFLILNERILRKKSTLISTNLSIKALKDTYSERIFSRIFDQYTFLKLTGDDIRLKKKLSGA